MTNLISFTLSLVFSICVGATPTRSLQDLGQGIYRFQEGHHFSIVLVGKESILLADTLSAEGARWLKSELEKRFPDRPVRRVIYSHNHLDHVGGGFVFDGPGVDFVSHELAKLDLVRNKAPTRIPNLTFSERMNFDFEGREIQLRYHGPNNGMGNISVFIPDAKFLFVVDWIVLRRLPFREMAYYDFEGMIDSIDQILSLDFSRIAPGHSVVGTKKDVIEFQSYLKDLRAAVLQGMNEGKSLAELQRDLKLPKYRHFAQYSEWLPLNIKGAYEQLERKSGRFGQER